MSQIEVKRPFDEEPITTFALQGSSECREILARSHALFQDRDGWLPASHRIEVLERAAQLIRERGEGLALQAAEEGGKPLSDSLVELRRAAQGVTAAVHELRGWAGREIPMGITERSQHRLAWTWREPRGVVFAISAFNHPFNLIVHQVVPAVAVGCPVIVKPAQATPLSCRNLVDILHEAGLPKEWCQMILCENEVTQQLVADPRVSFVTFIGSSKVGWQLRSQLAPGADCALEHGGVAPVVVEPSADLRDAIPLLVKAGYYHAGQVCVSVQRIYAHEDIADRFIERFVSEVQKLEVGDPTQKTTDVGPLIRPGEVERIHEWVTEAAQAGGKIACGGKPIGRTCYEPTVVIDPPDEVRLSREEIFGPVVAVYRYHDREEAIARANQPADAYFQASVFTKDVDAALYCSRRLNGMAIMVNDHPAFRVDWMPFGGHRGSGLGTGGIPYSMHDMSLERMVVFRSDAL